MDSKRYKVTVTEHDTFWEAFRDLDFTRWKWEVEDTAPSGRYSHGPEVIDSGYTMTRRGAFRRGKALAERMARTGYPKRRYTTEVDG